MASNANAPENNGAEGAVPQAMLQQAEAAAAANERDVTVRSGEARPRTGYDVAPIGTHDLEQETEQELPSEPPPAYGEQFGELQHEDEGLSTQANVGDDGRVNINIRHLDKNLSSLLNPALRRQQSITDHSFVLPPAYIPPYLGGDGRVPPPPPMNVVIQVVGSRGDVQPFIALGKVLKERYGHRVRLATHPNFEEFVTEHGLDFFSIGGDPSALMAFMVKNPGLMPGFDTLRSGDIGSRRKEVGQYLRGCWRSCYEAGNGLGAEANDDTVEEYWSQENPDTTIRPFVADCIIANPPSFAHVHIAEKMGIPLHVMFTMPYSPTTAFPHPLANIQSTNADMSAANYISYALIDMMTWQGLGDVINRFREKSLGLEPISLIWAPGMLQRLKIPHTYCWSPALIPKPKDWGQNISISGFFFLNLASNYTPAPDLQAFLDAGPPPVYIGFGSIVLDDPDAMTKLIFEAAKATGQRVLLSKGWGGMGAEDLGLPDGIFMLGNVPHDWLFNHVSCVVHHGGAGTTAAGITAGKPTVIVPFFGDQPFWGAMVARAGAGPEPIPHKELTAQKLADAINFCLKPDSQAKAKDMAAKIAEEKGSDLGAQSFHQQLDVDKLRCTLSPSRIAVWRVKRTQVMLSAMVACTLAEAGELDFSNLKLFRPKEYETDDGPWDPITGGGASVVGTATQMMMGVADLPSDTLRMLRIHPDVRKSKKKAEDEAEAAEASAPAAGISQTAKKTPSTTGDASTTPSKAACDVNSSAEASPYHTPRSSPGNSTLNLQQLTDENDSSSTLSISRSRSRSRSRTKKPAPQDYLDTAMNTGKGVSQILGAAFKSPMDTTWAIARGFHNAPKLYGDDTVRDSEHISDLRTGIKAASKEFGLGLYDGITGLVTQPVRGAQKEGAAGFIKGFGKGLGGIVLKPSAAGMAIPGYVMKGMYKELKLSSGSSVQNYIIASRTAQGFEEMLQSSVEEREDVVRRWKQMQGDIKRKKDPDDIVKEVLAEKREGLKNGIEHTATRLRANSNLKADKLSAALTGKKASGLANSVPDASDPDEEGPSTATSRVARPTPTEHHALSTADEAADDLEEAIHRSVLDTSLGNAEEDAEVERAVRASMTELYMSRAGNTEPVGSEDEDLRRAIEASIAESHSQGAPNPLYDEELERALSQSLCEQRAKHHTSASDSQTSSDITSPEAAADDDRPPAYDQGHISGTTQQAFETQSAAGEKTQQEQSEEDVVMEYVKKQSLLEQRHRQAMNTAGAGSSSGAGADAEHDEELQRALKASMTQQ